MRKIIDKNFKTYYDSSVMNLFAKHHIYPPISITLIRNPSRFYAIPLLGFIIKCIILIPQFFELMILGFVGFLVIVVINPWVILLTGKYWDFAYVLSAGMYRLYAKIYFFFMGLTDTYPGFDFTIHDTYTIEIKKPTSPSRLRNVPFFGFLFKLIILIPFLIYENVIRYAAYFGVIGASFVVLFTGRYPESSYELVRDEVRLNFAAGMYLFGLSDTYPSFWISMNHSAIKWLLIILSIVYVFGNTSVSLTSPKKSHMEQRNYMYYQNEMKDGQTQYEQTAPEDIKTGY